MKIILLHGPGEVAKRNELLKIKKQFNSDNQAVIDLKQSDLNALHNLLMTTPLFDSGKRLIIIENAPVSLDLSEVSGGENLDLVVVAGSLPAASVLLKSAQKLSAKILVFEGEREISAFPFLDSLLEKKPAAFIHLNKLLEQYNEMYILSMVYYGLRRNILPLPASSFVQKKVIQQKKLYQDNDWIKLYQLTLLTEFEIKSGALTSGLALTKLVQQFIGI
jgi:DNA polymerase III delta subunit